MNNKGFSLVELLAVIIIIGIVAIIVVPSVTQYIDNASNTAYESYERSMSDAAKSRIIECQTDFSLNCNLRLPYKMSGTGSETRMDLSTLISEGYIDSMKDPNSNDYCDSSQSYVKITLERENSGEYIYSACLVCGDYKTEGC